MKIAIAQHAPKAGAIAYNINKHSSLIEKAVDQHCDAVFFNELSLTAYEPDQAEELQLELTDKRLSVFQNLSNQYGITIGIGLPLKTSVGIEIATAVFQKHKSVISYGKQLLHQSEADIFVPGTSQLIITVKGIKIALGICYETLQDEHISHCKQLGADIYVVSTAKKQAGLEAAMNYYQKASKNHQIPILMSNSFGPTTRFECIGQSAIWNSEGVLLKQLSKEEESILYFTI